jgi:hypothetical protein
MLSAQGAGRWLFCQSSESAIISGWDARVTPASAVIGLRKAPAAKTAGVTGAATGGLKNEWPWVKHLPRIAASRKRGVLEVGGIWPIDNRPQDAILPYNKIVAAREDLRLAEC